MAAARPSQRLAERVRERARHRCEYCLTAEWLTGQPGEIDHVVPRAQGGATRFDNLCLACAACNGFKLDRTAGFDPETGQTVPLFNPRAQRWPDHFAWSDDGTHIIGLTPSGRGTILILKMNRPLVVVAREIWVSMNRHPPSD
jgi:hypothetical protein